MAPGKEKTHQDTEEFAGQLKCCSRLAVRGVARAFNISAPRIPQGSGYRFALAGITDPSYNVQRVRVL